MNIQKILIAASICAVLTPTFAAEPGATRFGALSVNQDNALLFKGKPTTPKLEGNNSLTVADVKSVGAADVALVQDNGGTACPVQLTFVKVTAAGATLTKPFGSCTDEYKLTQEGTKLVVKMSGFRGPNEPKKEQIKASKQKMVYVFEDGVLTENGKVVK